MTPGIRMNDLKRNALHGRPLKVAIVTQFPPDPGSPKGGVEAVSVNLVKALAAFDDMDIHVVTTTRDCASPEAAPWGRVTVHRLPRGEGSTLSHAIGRGRREIKGYLRMLGPDVVHAHDTYGLMVTGLAMPRVFTIHGFIYGDTLVSRKKLPWLRSQLWRWIEQRGWRDQPHIISISPYVRERLTGVASGTIHDIDNPISADFFDIARHEQKNVIFSAAVISPRKNTLCLVEAVDKIRQRGVDVQLRLAGPVVNREYGQMVEQRIKDCGLDTSVILLGSISADRVREELARARVFALVSLEENSPLGIEEAMAAGVPVVTSNRCGMPYMVRHGESGYLVNPLDADDVASRLSDILSKDELARTMSEQSRAIALDRFHPARVASRTRNVYYEIANP
jgi:glycosyltransferase involved in cell wall biosynthesis